MRPLIESSVTVSSSQLNMELEEAKGHNPQSGVEAPVKNSIVKNSIEQNDHLILRLHEREDWKKDGEEDVMWSQTDKEDNTGRLLLHVITAGQLSRVSIAAMLYFFICAHDLMTSFFAETVLDTVLTVQQAMFTIVANIETSFTSAIVLLAQVMKKMDFSRGFVGAKSFISPKVQAVFRYFCMQKTQRWKGCAFLLSIICLNMAPCQGADVIILANSSHTFNCSVENIQGSLWQILRNDGTFVQIAQNGNLFSRYEDKYTLRIYEELSENNTSFSHQMLTLIQGAEDDDGQYRCQEGNRVIKETNLTVAIPPVLQLLKDNVSLSIGSTIDVVSDEEVMIQCVAEGGKPPGQISWRVNGERVTSHPALTSQRRVISTLPYVPAERDTNVTCVSSGQKVIPQQEFSVEVNVQYLPKCNMITDKRTNQVVITCSCDAIPEVKSYKFFVNGSHYSDNKSITLSSDKPAAVYCEAGNDVGIITTNPENVEPVSDEDPNQNSKASHVVWLGVGLLIIIVIVMVAVVLQYCYKRIRDAERRADTYRGVAIYGAKLLQAASQSPPQSQGQEVRLQEQNGGHGNNNA